MTKADYGSYWSRTSLPPSLNNWMDRQSTVVILHTLQERRKNVCPRVIFHIFEEWILMLFCLQWSHFIQSKSENPWFLSTVVVFHNFREWIPMIFYRRWSYSITSNSEFPCSFTCAGIFHTIQEWKPIIFYRRWSYSISFVFLWTVIIFHIFRYWKPMFFCLPWSYSVLFRSERPFYIFPVIALFMVSFMRRYDKSLHTTVPHLVRMKEWYTLCCPLLCIFCATCGQVDQKEISLSEPVHEWVNQPKATSICSAPSNGNCITAAPGAKRRCPPLSMRNSLTRNRTRVFWIRVRYPNRWTMREFEAYRVSEPLTRDRKKCLDLVWVH